MKKRWNTVQLLAVYVGGIAGTRLALRARERRILLHRIEASRQYLADHLGRTSGP